MSRRYRQETKTTEDFKANGGELQKTWASTRGFLNLLHQVHGWREAGKWLSTSPCLSSMARVSVTQELSSSLRVTVRDLEEGQDEEEERLTSAICRLEAQES